MRTKELGRMVSRRLLNNNDASVIPLLMFVLVVFGGGALYTLLFLEIAIPELAYLVPASDSKTFILMCIYAIPLAILVISGFATFKAALKRHYYGGG